MANFSDSYRFPSPKFPEIHILCTDETFIKAFKEAQELLDLATMPIQIHNCNLSELPSSVRFDVLGLPNRSADLVKEGFNGISREFSPSDDEMAFMRLVDGMRHDDFPSNYNLTPIAAPFVERSRKVRGTSWVVRFPAVSEILEPYNGCDLGRLVEFSESCWHRSFPIRHLLETILDHNPVSPCNGNEEVQSVLMAPMTMFDSWISAERRAEQTATVIKRMVDIARRHEKESKADMEYQDVIDERIQKLDMKLHFDARNRDVSSLNSMFKNVGV
ncbi:hypothetical protein QQX98_005640 [Neonectria punicea]|uniref:Uncharacterized protein n=1 Tax=Neonectria punicea TaxID=979145 RepID=A0ABR1H4B1_9HYPO